MTERSAAAHRPTIRTAATARFGSGVLKGLIVLLMMLAVAMAGYGVVSYWMTPWAHATSDRSALVGYWQGEVVFGPGDERRVALHLEKFTTLKDILLDNRGTTGSTEPDISVAAKVCGPEGATRYHGSGDVKNREGSRFAFGLDPDGSAHGSYPGEFQGLWDGNDRLELTSRLSTRGPDGASAAASIAARPEASGGAAHGPEDGVIRFEMRRSSARDFDAAC
jgi:hypothetical protein